MPRILKNEDLIKRGARIGESQVTPIEEKKPEEVAAPSLVGEVKIDTTPIADAVAQLSDVVKKALECNAPLLEKIIEKQLRTEVVKKAPEEWEFKIARDSRGRIETIKAVATG
jgi:hypothetical protein